MSKFFIGTYLKILQLAVSLFSVSNVALVSLCMVAKLLDGSRVARLIRADLAKTVQRAATLIGRPPGLAVVQVGRNTRSSSYIRGKEAAALNSKLQFRHVQLPADVSFQELREHIDVLNRDAEIDGVMVQLPLATSPLGRLVTPEVLDLIDPAKDVDGLHTVNVGRFHAMPTSRRSKPELDERTSESLARLPFFVPCTALGIRILLDQYAVPLKGQRAVVIGRSNIVGRPVARVLDQGDCIVTLLNEEANDVSLYTREADIVVAAAGVRGMIGAQELSVTNRTVVVDVGIHPTVERGMVGDVAPDAWSTAMAISPVPGGVGPMTVLGLLLNTYYAYCRNHPKLLLENPDFLKDFCGLTLRPMQCVLDPEERIANEMAVFQRVLPNTGC